MKVSKNEATVQPPTAHCHERKASIKSDKPPAGIVEKIVEKLWIKMLAFKNDL